MQLKTFSLSFLGVLILTNTGFSADTFEIDPTHSAVTFSVRHLVSRVPGQFREFSGTIVYDTTDVTKSSVSTKILANSIDTNVERRDNHLRSADFFDVQQYPDITFESKSVKKDPTAKGGNRLVVTGILILHGVAKEVILPVEVLGVGSDPWGGTRIGFEASITLNKKEFNISWNKILDQGGFLLGDEVKVNLAIEAVKKKEEGKK
ncbi:MAG: polyisoprenoid-binding protein [Candidatus Latescibacteria bacterium]|nr:polyisoprenoid-binding protein [Candidatus Latescibacterota bacterium]